MVNGINNNYQQTAYPPIRNNNMYQPYTYPTWPNQVYNQNVTPINQENINVSNNNIIWVQGEGGAKSYIVPNGSTYALWDSEQQTIYVKSVDINGRPTMTVLDYVDRNAPSDKETNFTDYVTQQQLSELSTQLNQQVQDLQKKLNDFKSRIGNLNNKREVK